MRKVKYQDHNKEEQPEAAAPAGAGEDVSLEPRPSHEVAQGRGYDDEDKRDQLKHE